MVQKNRKMTDVKSLYCVEFPGKVLDVDRAVQCLGGVNKIAKAFCESKKKLECRFRPDDYFSKPTIADRSSSTSFVLRVRVKGKKSYPRENNEDVMVSSSVVGKVEQVFKFRNFCDFQFLPMERNADGVNESICHKIFPKSTVPLSWDSESVPFYFPPTLFSRSVSASFSRPDSGVQPYLSAKVIDENSTSVGNYRDRRSNHVRFVSHDLKEVPTAPIENTLRYIKQKIVSEKEILQMKKLFDERPIWTRSALECVTRFPIVQLKYLLSLNSYHFTSGPFRIAWVRFGYDPRKDPSSRQYQVLDYRLRNFVFSSMREYFPAQFAHGRTKSLKNVKNEKTVNPFDENLYKFKPGVIPPQKQMFYQICDIEIPEVQERLNNFSESNSYDAKNGWLTELFLDKVRDAIDKEVLATVTSLKEEAGKVGMDSSSVGNIEVNDDDSAEEMVFSGSDRDDFMDTNNL